MQSQKKHIFDTVMRKWKILSYCSKMRMLLSSRLKRFGRKYLLLDFLGLWQDFVAECVHRKGGLQRTLSLQHRTNENILQDVSTASLSDVIDSVKTKDCSLEGRDLIEGHDQEVARLKRIIDDKDKTIFQREQSISIRDKWLEQLSIESQVKDVYICKGLC